MFTKHLNCRAYQNAGQDDLFQAMTDQANTNNVNLPASVKTIMDPWTFQMGYPVVNITRNYVTGSATATQVQYKIFKEFNFSIKFKLLKKTLQERFLRVPTDDTTVYRWWVPLSYRTLSSPLPSFAWIPDTTQSITIPTLGATSNQWVLFNVDQGGKIFLYTFKIYYKYIPNNSVRESVRSISVLWVLKRLVRSQLPGRLHPGPVLLRLDQSQHQPSLNYFIFESIQ